MIIDRGIGLKPICAFRLIPLDYSTTVIYDSIGSATLFRDIDTCKVSSLFSVAMISDRGFNDITGALPIARASSISFLRV